METRPVFDAGALSDELLASNPILVEKIDNALNGELPVAKALREVLRFMFLVSQQDGSQLTPSHTVDLAWHEFILCTKAYQEFCEQHFSRMIHHYPGGLNSVHRTQFCDTRKQYEKHFGRPEPEFWGPAPAPAADCGACESA